MRMKPGFRSRQYKATSEGRLLLTILERPVWWDPECVECCTREAFILKEADVNSPSRKAYVEKASKLLDMRWLNLLTGRG